jgi:hypothetical protein
MGLAGVVFGLFTVGYILGVWTAFAVLKQPQRAYEDAVHVSSTDIPVILLRDASHNRTRRP